MNLLQEKLSKYTAPQEAQAAGVYPYFRAISSEQDPEVIMNGKKVRVGVSLLVGNIDNMVRFYRDILGFQTQWNGGSFADFETASGDF